MDEVLQLVVSIFDVDVCQAGVVEPALASGALVHDFLSIDVKSLNDRWFWGLFNHVVLNFSVRD